MKWLLAVAMIGSVSACTIQWPNNTDTTFQWWQCSTGPVQIFNVTPWDSTGKNYEYPIHLNTPLIARLDMNDPASTYTDPNLRSTVNIWEWDRNGCAWTSVPTFGLLANLDACKNGVPCPVKPGKQILDVTLDFTQYNQIISLLKDDYPYQLQYSLRDKASGDYTCVMAQARARIH